MAGLVISRQEVTSLAISCHVEADLTSTLLIEAGLFACCKQVNAG